MLSNIAAFASAFGALAALPSFQVRADVVEDFHYRVNQQIEVISVYKDALNRSQKETMLEAEAPEDIQDGDMLLMFIATSGGVHKRLPHGFSEIIPAEKDKGDLALYAAYKIWENGDSRVFPVEKSARNLFVSMITLRGPKIVIDASANINTAGGSWGDAIAPRVQTANLGALVTAFAYDDPHAAKISNQETLVSMRNGDDGIAVGISSSKGGLSKRIRARGESSQKGGGDDIAMALAIY